MRIVAWIVFIFFIIGIGNRLYLSPLSILGPIVLAGILYYLYRHPPLWLIRISGTGRHMQPKKKKRRNPFKVISGKK